MPVRESAPVGAPIWIDLATSDPGRAKDFYTALFGWDAQETGEEFGNYVNFSKSGALIAGMVKNPQPGAPDAWTTYLSSTDAKATTDAASAGGGQVFFDPMDVMGLGTMAVIADPGGAVVGVWQPGTHKGTGLVGEPGTPSWHELHTKNYDAVIAFYQNTFGWKTAVMGDTDDFRYSVLVDDAGEQYAGVMDASGFLPPEVQSNWQIYFASDDVDATLAKVTELGGAIVLAAEDTPYGRLAQASDPTGAIFRLRSLPTS